MNRDTLWSVVLVTTGAAMGLVLLCIAPFAGMATFAGRTLSRRSATLAIAAMWAINQAVGFSWSHYPRDLATAGWGGAILVASLAAGYAATRVRVTAFAFLAAFAAFEAVLFGWSLVVGDRGAFTPRIVAQIFAGNLFGVAVFGAIRLAMTAAGAARSVAGRRGLR